MIKNWKNYTDEDGFLNFEVFFSTEFPTIWRDVTRQVNSISELIASFVGKSSVYECFDQNDFVDLYIENKHPKEWNAWHKLLKQATKETWEH